MNSEKNVYFSVKFFLINISKNIWKLYKNTHINLFKELINRIKNDLDIILQASLMFLLFYS